MSQPGGGGGKSSLQAAAAGGVGGQPGGQPGGGPPPQTSLQAAAAGWGPPGAPPPQYMGGHPPPPPPHAYGAPPPPVQGGHHPMYAHQPPGAGPGMQPAYPGQMGGMPPGGPPRGPYGHAPPPPPPPPPQQQGGGQRPVGSWRPTGPPQQPGGAGGGGAPGATGGMQPAYPGRPYGGGPGAGGAGGLQPSHPGPRAAGGAGPYGQQGMYGQQMGGGHYGTGGGMAYGGAAGGRPAAAAQVQPPAPKRVLTITDKDGNPIDISGKGAQKSGDASAGAAPVGGAAGYDAAAAKANEPTDAEKAGASLREAAMRAIKEGGAAAIKKKEEEERKRKAEEEERERKRKAEEEERERKRKAEEEERLRKEEEERLRKEEEDRLRKEEEERLRKEEEERLRKEEEERKIREEEERLRKEEEDRKRREEEEKQRIRDQLEKARKEAEARLAREAEEKARKAAEERARAQEEARRAAEERAAAAAAPPAPAPARLGPGSSLKPGGGSSLRPGSSSLRPGSSAGASAPLRPGGTRLRPGGAGVGGPSPGLRPGGARAFGGSLRPGAPSTSAVTSPPPGLGPGAAAAPSADRRAPKKRRVFTKEEMMRFRDLDICCCRPSDLPDMTIQRGAGGGGGGGGRGPRGGGGGGQWARGSQQPNGGDDGRGGGGGRRSQRGGGGGGEQWARGQAPPKPPPNRGGRGGGGGRRGGGPPPDEYLGPVAPLVRSENRWVPVKDTSTMVVTEKLVKSILNKMTKEKFERLSNQMCEVPILSYEMLTMMIHNIYEKAIMEPTFGDMYADLCVKLSQTAKGAKFIQIIESDEEPPTEDGEAPPEGEGGSSHNIVYRWSNDVDTNDSEIVGPFESPDECVDAALANEEDCPDPVKRGDMELKLHSLKIKDGIFIKIMQPKGDPDKFYTVFFPVSKAEECGQQMSEIFLSERECMSNATKLNSFKRSLLNKCEDEFNKQDIYVDWKKEKKAYQESKASLKEAERNEKEEELEFRRMKIKKQMLGNIKFIGELYKKDMLREKIMRYCIQSLLKLEEDQKSGRLKNAEDDEMDEEDHEALCNLFTTIGKTIDHPNARPYMEIYFAKMRALSNDKALSSRARFMYKDLIELRSNRWKSRRKQETAKTLDEIRKDMEREERAQAQQSQQGYRGGDRRESRGGRGMGGGDYRGDSRRTSGYGGGGGGASRRNVAKPKTDEHGFTQVGRGGKSSSSFAASTPSPRGPPTISGSSRRSPPRERKPAAAPSVPALSKEKLELRVKNMKAEFMQDPDEKELLLSMDELAGTPDAGKTMVQVYGDASMDCKDAEREAIIKILSLLFQKGKLSTADFDSPLGELVEFIDSFVVDSPKAVEYLADMLAEFIHIKAVSVSWLCKQVGKIGHAPDIQERVIASTIDSLKKMHGVAEAKLYFGGSSAELSKVLGSDKWSAMSSKLA